MAIAKYKVMAKGGEYTDQNGQTKNRWNQHGMVFENEQGQLSLKLDSVPETIAMAR